MVVLKGTTPEDSNSVAVLTVTATRVVVVLAVSAPMPLLVVVFVMPATSHCVTYVTIELNYSRVEHSESNGVQIF